MSDHIVHYRIEGLLGEGSFATVYRAYDEKFKQPVALKVLKPKWLDDPQAIERFKQEAITVRKLRHPHIIDVFDVGEGEGQIFLAQFLVEGETLADHLTRGPMKWREVVKIVTDIGSALDYAHKQGVIHRDIKPQNILLNQDGESFLGDFGLVRAVEGSTHLSSTMSMIGTAHYMAPEVWRGKKSIPATDIYALSCVVSEMLTGKVLFEGSSMAELTTQHIIDGPTLPDEWPAGVPNGVTEVLQRGLAVDPSARTSSGGALAAELSALEDATIFEASPSAKKPDMWLVSADGQRHGLQQGTTTLGRAANTDIQIDSPAASRQHTTIELDGQNCTIYDKGSANGTFVNGQRVGPGGTAFKPGDQLKIGDLLFTLETATAAAPPPPAEPAPPKVDQREDTTIIPAVKSKTGSTAAAAPPKSPSATQKPQPSPQPAAVGGINKGLLIGGGVALLAIVGVIIIIVVAFGMSTPEPETITVVETVIVEKENQGGTTTVVEKVVTVEVEKEVEKLVTSRGTGGTVNLLYWQAASILNPYLSGGTKDIEAASIILEPLARYDENGNLVPWLVDEIPTVENGGVSENLTSITWTLKEGLLWSDGTSVTAEDVVFTAEYCLNEDMGCNASYVFADVESVEALDELTVQVNFSTAKPFPYGPFVGAESPIIQKAQFEDCQGEKAQQCTQQNFAPIGTGPYKAIDFKANDVVVYELNENYRDPNKPFFSEVVFKGGGDAASAARAVLETGEADYAWNLQVVPQILNEMALAGKGKVINSFGSSVERLMVNFTNPDPGLGDKRSEWTKANPNPHPFLTDINVRRALSLAIDRSAIATQLYGYAGQTTCNVLPAPAIYVSTANDECLVQDIDLANQILDDAGIVDTDGDGIREKDGVPLVILYQTSTNSVRQKTQALVKQWWSQIGIETELKNIDAAVFFGGDPNSPDTYGKFYADIEMYTNNFSGIDPESYMLNWTCDEIAAAGNQWLGNNIPRWCNEEYDALAAEMAQTAELDKRAEIAKQQNDMLMQDYVMIPLVHRGDVSAHSNTLLGVRMNSWDSELWNIADWTRSGR